jgi:hypothetical protein
MTHTAPENPELGRMDSNHHSGIQSPASCL